MVQIVLIFSRVKEKKHEKIEKYELLKEEVGKAARGEESVGDSSGAMDYFRILTAGLDLA